MTLELRYKASIDESLTRKAFTNFARLSCDSAPPAMVADPSSIPWLGVGNVGCMVFAPEISLRNSHHRGVAENSRAVRAAQCGGRSPATAAKHDPADSEPNQAPRDHRGFSSVSEGRKTFRS